MYTYGNIAIMIFFVYTSLQRVGSLPNTANRSAWTSGKIVCHTTPALRDRERKARTILGDPGAVSRDDTMFVVKVYRPDWLPLGLRGWAGTGLQTKSHDILQSPSQLLGPKSRGGGEHCVTPAGAETRALSIQQKFRFEISEILRVQWNGTFRLHRPDPSHRALGYCSCSRIQKSGTGDNNLSNGKEHFGPTDRNDQTGQRGRPRSDETEMVRSILCSNRNYRKFRSKTQWIGSVQPEKFRKHGSIFWGGPLFPVGPVGILVEWIAPLGWMESALGFTGLCHRPIKIEGWASNRMMGGNVIQWRKYYSRCDWSFYMIYL